MFHNKIIFSLLMVVALCAMTSCSEDDNTIEEYADWTNVNNKYFDALTEDVTGTPSVGNWKRIRVWSKNEAAATANSDYVLMQYLGSDPTASDECPQYTDSVKVHYQGRLIPSSSYPKGYIFDSSFSGNFDPAIANPSKFAVNGLVDGFTTALMNMHRGDYYRVYIPYQLGYGTSDYESIPGGSTLIFEIRLVDFW